MAEIPAQIGPYQILSRIGMGGMAETYLAVRRGPGAFEQRVCLKRIRSDLHGDPEFVRQFMVEATLAARLRHTAIAQVLDFGQSGEDYFLALELIDGLDLRAVLEAFPKGLPAELVQWLATELATALNFAHRGGAGSQGAIVHRDVSPSNVLISLEGEIKLTDFGIARSLTAPQHTRTGIVKGKVPYLAPEYARTGRFDTRSDLFSLGVVLYECLCGERPHDGATDLETLERASRGEHPALATRVPDAAGLAQIIEGLLAPEPELRTQNAAELIEALSGLPASARARRDFGVVVSEQRRLRQSAVLSELTTARADAPKDATPVPSASPRASLRTQPLRQAKQIDDSPSLPSKTFTPKRGPRLALALAIGFALSVTGFALSRTPRSSERSTQEPSQPSAEQTVPEAPATQTFEAATPTERSPGKPSTASAKKSAALEVIVLPYGEVSVDGQVAGAAPVTLPLAAGKHIITARSGKRTLQRSITLSPGERRQLILR